MLKLLDDSDKFDQSVHEKKNGHKGIDNYISPFLLEEAQGKFIFHILF